jgi:chaperonin GroES
MAALCIIISARRYGLVDEPQQLAVSQESLPHLIERTIAVMKIVPLGGNVVVKRLPSEEVTAGGIVLSDAAREKSRQGRVLSIGDGRMLANGSRAKHQVQEGDRVLFGSYAGTEVDIEGEEFFMMSEDEILAILP